MLKLSRGVQYASGFYRKVINVMFVAFISTVYARLIVSYILPLAINRVNFILQGFNMLNQCKRCLLNELDETELFRSISEYINAMPKEQRVSESEYQTRLSLCRQCDHLMNGMCAICGCFVELRAAKQIMHCAAGSKAVW